METPSGLPAIFFKSLLSKFFQSPEGRRRQIIRKLIPLEKLPIRYFPVVPRPSRIDLPVLNMKERDMITFPFPFAIKKMAKLDFPRQETAFFLQLSACGFKEGLPLSTPPPGKYHPFTYVWRINSTPSRSSVTITRTPRVTGLRIFQYHLCREWYHAILSSLPFTVISSLLPAAILWCIDGSSYPNVCLLKQMRYPCALLCVPVWSR